MFGLDSPKVSEDARRGHMVFLLMESCSGVLRLSLFVCVCRPSAQVRSGRAAVNLDKLGDEDGSEDGQEEHTDT